MRALIAASGFLLPIATWPMGAVWAGIGGAIVVIVCITGGLVLSNLGRSA